MKKIIVSIFVLVFSSHNILAMEKKNTQKGREFLIASPGGTNLQKALHLKSIQNKKKLPTDIPLAELLGNKKLPNRTQALKKRFEEKAFSANTLINDKKPLIFFALLNNDQELLKILLPDYNENTMYQNFTLLTYALAIPNQKVRIACLETLLEYKININKKDSRGMGDRPLNKAIKIGCAKSVKLLLNHKADIECKTFNELTPLSLAQQKNQENPTDASKKIISMIEEKLEKNSNEKLNSSLDNMKRDLQLLQLNRD